MTSTEPGKMCSLLVNSWDGYSDLWLPFFTLLHRHWPDCPFPIFLGTSEKIYDDPRVTSIPVGSGHDWSRCTRKQLETLQTPYVLMMLEDFMLRGRVKTQGIISCLDTAIDLNADMLRLMPMPPPNEKINDYPFLGRCNPNTLYRVDTQASIWKIETLLKLLRNGETAWEFEINASERSNEIKDGIYSVWRPFLTYKRHVVVHGKWFHDDAKRFKYMNIGCDFGNRGTVSCFETIWWRIRDAIQKIFPSPRRQLLKLISSIRNFLS